MKEEFKKRHLINRLYLPQTKTFGEGDDKIRREDYLANPDHVVPTADPRIISDQMRIQQAAELRAGAHTVPGYNIEAVERRWLKALKIDGIDEVYPGPDKVPPLPNPKMQVEELRFKAKQMDLEYRKQEFILDLMEARKETAAKILLLHAQAAKLMSDIEDAQAARKLESIEMAISLLEAHLAVADRQIAQAGEKDSGDSKGDRGSDGGGVQRLAPPSGDEGVPGASREVAGGVEGAVG